MPGDTPTPAPTPRRCYTCQHWERFAYAPPQGIDQQGECFGVPPHVDDVNGAFPVTYATDRCPLWTAKETER